jgi:hypothetical protein
VEVSEIDYFLYKTTAQVPTGKIDDTHPNYYFMRVLVLLYNFENLINTFRVLFITIILHFDNKIFWKFIKSKTKAKESIPCILGGINTDDKTKSELLNTFFQSVFTVEADSQNAPTLNQDPIKSYFSRCFCIISGLNSIVDNFLLDLD